MSLISEPHRGQTKGSISYTFAISRAHAERQAACDTVVGSVASAGGDIGSAWDSRHPWGRHVVTRIEGRHRIEAVEIAPLAEGRPDPARAFRLACDTVLLSVGLVPENELSRAAGVAINEATGGPFVGEDLQTGGPGVFACGNVLHMRDLADFVTEEAERCGEAAAAYLAGAGPDAGGPALRVVPGANIRYVVPNAWQPGRDNVLYCRPLVVKNGAVLTVRGWTGGVRRRKLAHVQPSEMIRVELAPAELLGAAPGQPNVLEVSLA